MKKLIIILIAMTLILGCNGNKTASKTKFPPEIAGTWKAKVPDSAWKFVISKDGKVEKATIPLFETEVKPNSKKSIPMQDGSTSYIHCGDFIANYNPVNRELFVSIDIKNAEINFMDIHNTNKTFDRFVGPISEDGKNWDAEWIYLFDYGPEMPQDMNEVSASHPFEKISD